MDESPVDIDRTHYASLDESLAIVLDDPLLFEPDADTRYSTFAFSLMGKALEEEVAGAELHTIVRQEVREPLRLTRTAC